MSVGDVDSTAEKHADASSDAPEPRPAWPRFAHVPALAMVAAAAALAHSLIAHLLLPLLASRGLGLPPLLHLAEPFSLNLAACAALVALTSATLDLALASELTYLGRRLMMAALAGVLLFMLSLGTFCPAPYLKPEVVLLGAGALHTFVVQVAMTALRAHGTLAGRTTVGLIAGSSLFALASLIVRNVEAFARVASSPESVATLHALGELAYLFAPIAAAFVVLPWNDEPSARAARRSGAFAVGIMAILFGAALRIPHALYSHVMYSTLRLEWALDRASLGYAVPVSLAVGAATAASFSRDPRHRQGGAGLWLWLAGGYNPLTPARIFMTSLAAMLICRAILSTDTESVGAARSKRTE